MEKLDAVRIVLTCPGCGNHIWIPDGEGGFKCLSCGDECYPEQMGSETESIECGF